MNDYLRITSTRGQLWCFFFLLIGGVVVASLIYSIVMNIAAPGHAAVDFTHPGSIVLLKFLQAVYTIFTFLIPAFFFSYFVYRDKPFMQLGFRKPATSNFYLLAVLLLLLSLPLGGWLGQLNHAIPLPSWMVHREKDADQEIVAFLKTGSFGGMLANIFLIAVIPAICEEACFRGALQPILIRSLKSPWAGIILTGIIFSAVHLQFQGFLPRMMLGILLGAVYWYSGSLWVSILAHFFTNAIQVVAVSYYPKFITEDPSVPVYEAIVSLGIVISLLILIKRQADAAMDTKVYAKENP